MIEVFFRISGRKRKFSDDAYIDKHLKKLAVTNERPYKISKLMIFTVPVIENTIDGHQCFIVNPGRRCGVMYLHGGSCVHQPLVFHWSFVNWLAEHADVTVYLPVYPKSPVHTFTETFDMLDSLYYEMLENHRTEDITIMGDSIGGNLALAYPQTLASKGLPSPKELVLLSPWLDMSPAAGRLDAFDDVEPRLAIRELDRMG